MAVKFFFDFCNEDGGDQKLNFERYVLHAMLDDVLNAANQRLFMMSRGQYNFSHGHLLDGRKKAGGLEIEITDLYNDTSRPLESLSGGESFLASLSLALGLADVVQSYAGGIHLDTVFIDEGFGSLDGETLDAAMKALSELQKHDNRLVGLISHVEELRGRIDRRLEVTKDREHGSRARFV